MMAESTSAERLDYLLEMALTIHEGIVEHLGGDDELDNQLVAQLKEVEHFIVVKKALESRRIEQAGNKKTQLAAGTITPPGSHQPSTARHTSSQSASPQSGQSLPSPSLFFSSPNPQGAMTSAPVRRTATRRIPGQTKGSKAMRKIRHAVPYASWVDKPK